MAPVLSYARTLAKGEVKTGRGRAGFRAFRKAATVLRFLNCPNSFPRAERAAMVYGDLLKSI